MRCSVFIDGNNFYHGLRYLYGKDKSLKKLNWKKFIEFVAGKNEVIDIFYYNARLDRNQDPQKFKSQEEFFTKLRKIKNLKIVLCRLLKRRIKDSEEDYYVLKEDDLHLAVDLIEGAWEDKYDVAFLISGDGDFLPAVEAVRRRGKKVVNVFYRNSSSRNLKNFCDSSIELNKAILDKFFS